MQAVSHSLGAVARFAGQVYTSDRLFEAGCQVAIALVGLLCMLLVIQHWPASGRPPVTTLPDEPCLFSSPPC
jgi:hypothetical protein